MVPSTYEDGTLYNVLPSGNKAPDETGNHNGYDQTRADFTFDRGNNLAATRVNADGLIEKGRENILLQSNQFDTTWVNSNTTETSGQIGYDGSSNAWLITKSASGAYIRQVISSSGVQTFSVYLKAESLNWVRLRSTASAIYSVYFDLSGSGAIGSQSGTIDANIESIGGGWFRCSITFSDSVGDVRIFPAEGDNDLSGTSGSIYIQSAQLEPGLVSTPYIETGATTAKAGILEDMPRIDYTSGTGALLLEGLRTNLFAQSEYFDSWGKNSNSSVQLADIASPDGGKNSYEFTFDGTTNGRIEQSVPVTNGTTYTFSIYLKNKDISDPTQVWIGFSANPFQGEYVTITNEWKRFDTTQVANGTTEYPRINYDGAGTLYAYGAQLEAGSHASSYIPTYGSAVSRSADSCSVTGVSDVIGQTEGTLFAEFEIGEENAHYFLYTNTSNAIYIQTRIGDMWRAYVINGGVYQVTITTGSVPTSGFVKMAFAYKENDFALYANGSLIGSDTSGSVPACDSYDLGLGPYGVGFSGKQTKQTALFNERLTNEELATLTTL